MSPGPTCKMNMLFTWDTTDLCVIFRWWHIHSTFTLLLSLVGVALLTAGYEGVREISRRYEISSAEYANTLPQEGIESRSFKWLGRTATQREQQIKLVKATLYAVQVFYSFFIMLLFMSYNGWIMISVAAGAFIGYLVFASGTATKTVACH